MAGFSLFPPESPLRHIGGGYFWTAEKYEIKRTSHFLYALIAYKNFKYRRYLAYSRKALRQPFWSALSDIEAHIPINIENDRPSYFEKFILGGVFDANLDEAVDYREKWMRIFALIDTDRQCRMIRPIRGNCSNNCKIVYLFDKKEQRKQFEEYLNSKKIAIYGGYHIPKEAKDCKKAWDIIGRVIELPIDPYENKMEYLKKSVEEFFAQEDEHEDCRCHYDI